MSVDPADQEGYADVYEEEPEPATEHGLETPREDAAEQRADLLRQREEPMTGRDEPAAVEADPADAAEQARVVELNEDEYR